MDTLYTENGDNSHFVLICSGKWNNSYHRWSPRSTILSHTYIPATYQHYFTQNKHMYMSVTKLETKNHGNLFQMNSEVIMINHNLYMKHNLQHKMDRTFTYTCKFVVVHVHSNYKSISVHKKTNDILVHLSWLHFSFSFLKFQENTFFILSVFDF